MYQKLTADANHPLTQTLINPKFAPGQILATPGALAAMEEHHCSPLSLLARHLVADWGSVPVEDAQLNDRAIQSGGRLLSSYMIGPGTRIWLITDQSETGNISTYLLPSEY
ncbi:MAG: hypothetical protein RLZZ298_1724 [Pseudomonadota bacterium]|jgi:hypothetical protein